jgi:hypothetical protein
MILEENYILMVRKIYARPIFGNLLIILINFLK